MSLPPSRRPGAAIEMQPLAPPPGSSAAPAAPLRGSQDTAAPGQQPNTAPSNVTTAAPNSAPIQTLPGLPPGQRQPRGTPQTQPAQPMQPAEGNAGDVPTEEVVMTPPPEKVENPTAVFSGLDKITGRTISFDVAINETVQFGALQVTPHVCYSRPPTEPPLTDSFVTVDEVTLSGEVRRIFNGWMFAASPGLNAVEHPIYDVWLTGCKGGASKVADTTADDTKAAAKPTPPARPRAAPHRATTVRPPAIQAPGR
jgi:hypothetical protein